MNTSSKISVVVLILVLGGSASAIRADGPAVAPAASPAAVTPAPAPPHHRASRVERIKAHVARELARLKGSLGLTKDQADQLAPILLRREMQLESLRNNRGLTTEEKKAKVQEIKQEAQSHIRSLLTPEQKQKYDATQPHAESAPGPAAGTPSSTDSAGGK
jgi:Spy/CpxP family protein refolding chaperone